jgi:hypothetical protein
MSVELDVLYDAIAQRTGITRVRDYRLEAVATDRALEARHTVGLDCIEPCEIPHPVPELKARTFPIQGTFKGVWENAFWTYRIEDQADPYSAALEAWWASPEHKANLLNDAATHHGLGVYFEDKNGSGNRRWYFIQLFTKPLLPNPDASDVILDAGLQRGFKFHDDGSLARTKTMLLNTPIVRACDGRAIINGSAYLHLTASRLADYWVAEDGHLSRP